MSEPLRNAPAPSGSIDTDREALIEQLLVAGLDHYFDGRYEQAINLWTRVAFLERGHGRARAYLERARGAIAERQRQSDELMHRGVAAYRAGDLEQARELLSRAAADGGSETALLFLQRLGIAEAGQAAASAPGEDLSARSRARADGASSPARPTNWVVTVAASAAVAGAIVLAAQPVVSWLAEVPAVGRPAASPDPLPVVRGAEIRLLRARQLFRDGRPHDALRQLEAIAQTDPLRADAETFIVAIQTQLLHPVASTPGADARPVLPEGVR